MGGRSSIIKFVQVLIVFTLVVNAISLFAQSRKDGLIRGLIFNATQEVAVDEKLISEIDKAYRIKDYEKVVRIYQQIPPRARLSAEDLFKVADSLFQTGESEWARDLGDRVASLRRGTVLACRAQLLKVKALYLEAKEREAQRLFQGLLGTFCEEELRDEIDALRYLIFGRKDLVVDSRVLKRTAEELSRARFGLYLRQGKLKEAERAIYDYLNLSGEYLLGRSLFFRLAETYFEKGDLQTAKKFYQLIITEWDHTKEAFLSKFRLYQIAYERATVKELLPQKTIDDLLMYIAQIKSKYPEEPIAESALFLSVRIFFDRKDWERVRERAKEFLSLYPESRSKLQVLDYYCKATSAIVPLLFLRGDVGKLLNISGNEQALLEESNCGAFYYFMGSEFYRYRLWEMSAYFLLRAFGKPFPEEYHQDYYLKLASLSNEGKDYETFEELMKLVEKRWGRVLGNNTEYLSLQFKRALRRDLERASKLLSEIWKSPIHAKVKEDFAQSLFLRAIEEKKYGLASSVLRTYLPGAGIENYLILLFETFLKDPNLFESLLEEAKRRFPDNSKLVWLEAYHLERKGDLRRVPELWKRLEESEGGNLERELALQHEIMKKLVERARNLIY